MSTEQENVKTEEEILAEVKEQLKGEGVEILEGEEALEGLLNEKEDESSDADKVAELEDQMLRMQAEMQNVRRRSEAEVDKARKFAVERFAKELLPVADNLERTIKAAGDSEEKSPLIEGVELTLKSLHDSFEKANLKAIDPVGEPFDPQLHEAISMVPAPDAEPGSVIDVVQKGYTLNDRVIRAAMVVVAKS